MLFFICLYFLPFVTTHLLKRAALPKQTVGLNQFVSLAIASNENSNVCRVADLGSCVVLFWLIEVVQQPRFHSTGDRQQFGKKFGKPGKIVNGSRDIGASA